MNPNNVFSASLCSSDILLDKHKVAKVGNFGLAKAMIQVLGGRPVYLTASFLHFNMLYLLDCAISHSLHIYSTYQARPRSAQSWMYTVLVW